MTAAIVIVTKVVIVTFIVSVCAAGISAITVTECVKGVLHG